MARKTDGPAAEAPPELPAIPEGDASDLQARIGGGTATGDAQTTFLDAAAAADAPAPAPEKRKRGRPRKDATSPAAAPRVSRPGGGHGRTKIELEADNAQMRARLDALDGKSTGLRLYTPEDLQNSKDAVMGLLALANLGAVEYDAAELAYQPEEMDRIGTVFARPAAPLLARLGPHSELIVACVVLIRITLPKVQAYRARVAEDRAKAEREGKQEIVQASTVRDAAERP